jgi:uncharacterized protein (PEP-CTERM system associated)
MLRLPTLAGPAAAGLSARLGLLAGTAALALLAAAPRAAAQDASGANGSAGGSAGGLDTGSLSSGASAPGVPPIAGALLPATGADPSQAGLRDHLLNAFGQNTPPTSGTASQGPAWQVQPSIGISESLTDNPNQFGGYNFGTQHHSDDAITQITPQVIVLGNTQRFQVNLNYAPTGVIYANNTDFSQFRQQFSGDVLATAMPGLVYFDLRGSVSQQPVFGGIGVVNTDILPPSQRETQSNLSASPYLVHSFGGTGTLQTGIGYIYSATDAPDFLNGGTAPVPLALPSNYGSQWLATRRVFASFTTGEDFGRFQDELDTDDSFYDGSGALRNAKRVLLTNDVSYAINRFISAIGEIGYENLSYPESAYSFVGGVWSAGARITPNGQSSVTLEYRHIDGLSSPYVHGYWQITPRLRVQGAYSQGITTFEQDQQNGLLSGADDATGAAASAVLAAPLVNNASLFGANQALSRAERATATVTYIAGRDVITGQFDHQRSSLVGNLLGLPPSLLAQLGISQAELAEFGLLTTQTNATTLGTVSWRHDLRPDLSSDLLVGYNRSSVAQTSQGPYSAIQLSVGLNKTFTRTLTGRIAYTGSYAVSGVGYAYNGQNSNTITFSLRKTF